MVVAQPGMLLVQLQDCQQLGQIAGKQDFGMSESYSSHV